jgi:hypothetical protein
MIERTMKAIVTKYATTSGPVLMEGSVCEAGFQVPGESKPSAFQSYFHGRDWHTDKRAATDDALERFCKKQVSLRNQLAALLTKRDKALKAIEGMEL